jgi:uncharacterized protein
MPEYLAPGVFIEEISSRAKSIQGVGTSVAGLVGPTRTGPLRGKPEVLTSFESFQGIFGDARPLVFGNALVTNHTAIAAKAFFDNGGKQLYAVRVVKDVNHGGSDGVAPGASDYAGESDVQKGSTGLTSLEDVDDVSIVMTPAAAAIPGDGAGAEHLAVVLEVQKHCRKMRYRVGLVDSRQGMSISEVRVFGSKLSDDRLALYYPWVVIADPNGVDGDIAAPPAGFIAGVYANTDVRRGVRNAPANEVVVGALRFEVEIDRFQAEVLNADRVNCLRAMPGLGMRVSGGRTLSVDPEWKYVNLRRYFLYLERSIEKGTQWAAFEPNGEPLWDYVRRTVGDFLCNEWRSGALLGRSPNEAYFVRCDRSTMTQNDLDEGRLVFLIGVAPLRPAEFVIFRISQKTAASF